MLHGIERDGDGMIRLLLYGGNQSPTADTKQNTLNDLWSFTLSENVQGSPIAWVEADIVPGGTNASRSCLVPLRRGPRGPSGGVGSMMLHDGLGMILYDGESAWATIEPAANHKAELAQWVPVDTADGRLMPVREHQSFSFTQATLFNTE